jgi:hypothetical protein
MANLTILNKKKSTLIKKKKRKIIKKKFIFLNKLSLKKKNLSNLINELKNEKYIIVNNLNNFNEKSKLVDLQLQAKLINTSQCRLLKLPFSGITKLIKFDDLVDLKSKINILIQNKQNFKILSVKFNQKLYLFHKIYQNLILQKSITKNNFLKNKLLFVIKNYQNVFVVFFFSLLKKNLFNLKYFYQNLLKNNKIIK